MKSTVFLQLTEYAISHVTTNHCFERTRKNYIIPTQSMDVSNPCPAGLVTPLAALQSRLDFCHFQGCKALLRIVKRRYIKYHDTDVFNFSPPRLLCSRLRPDVRDRQTDVRQTDILYKRSSRGRTAVERESKGCSKVLPTALLILSCTYSCMTSWVYRLETNYLQ